jgi:succinate dehydrogenase / fumarate reductase, iron-sulfur subunit
VITRALLRRKVTPKGALAPHRIPKDALKECRSIFEKVDERTERLELNLYISGYDEESEGTQGPNASAAAGGGDGAMSSAPGPNPEGRTKE